MREGQATANARALRRSLTDAERKLWSFLRLRQLEGYRFRRQHPIGKYIADFACIEARLVVELDGGQHNGSVHDVERDAEIKQKGFAVLRVWNNDVMANPQGVCEVIAQALSRAPTPALPREQGRGR